MARVNDSKPARTYRALFLAHVASWKRWTLKARFGFSLLSKPTSTARPPRAPAPITTASGVSVLTCIGVFTPLPEFYYSYYLETEYLGPLRIT
jgi:hypothetical protein